MIRSVKTAVCYASVCLALNLWLLGSLYFVLQHLNNIVIGANTQHLEAVIESTRTELRYKSPGPIKESNVHNHVTDIVRRMQNRIGKTGEVIIVHQNGPVCTLVLQSKSAEVNSRGGEVECRGHVLATFLQGRVEGFEKANYRGEHVYAIGERISRQTRRSKKPIHYALIVSISRDEFYTGYRNEKRTLIIQQMVFALTTIIGCFVGYRLQSKGARLYREMQAMIRALPIGLVKLPIKKRKFTYSNDVANKLFQRELEGVSDRDIVPEEYWEAHDEGIKKLVEGGEPDALNKTSRDMLHGLLPDGSKIPVGINIAQIDTEDGIVVVGTIVDLSELVKERAEKEKFLSLFMQAQKSLIEATQKNTEIIKSRSTG